MRISDNAAYRQCLYCNSEAASKEHVLASALGGWFTSRRLLCGYHNNQCGVWADQPLATEYAPVVLALEVRKGDGSRGATLTLQATSGAKYKMLPNFSFELLRNVEQAGDGTLRVVLTRTADVSKIERQISATADQVDSHSEIRSENFTIPVDILGAASRGVLKAALHFVAAISPDRESARMICQDNASIIFSDQKASNVSLSYFEFDDHGQSPHKHEMIAWTNQSKTLVLVRIFNLANYVVTLPYILIEPTRYVQNTQNGSRVIKPTAVPKLVVDEQFSTNEATKAEYARRLDEIMRVAFYKSDIADILHDVCSTLTFRSAVTVDARRILMDESLRENLKWRSGGLTSWALREVHSFGQRQIMTLSERS